MAPSISMLRAFKIAYDGRRFSGSTRQPHHRTVEGSIIKALTRIGAIGEGKDGGLRSASRTDKGVSALGNVITIESEMEGEAMAKAVNGICPQEGIWFLGWADPPEDFKPRHASERWYRYLYPVPPRTDPELKGPDIDKMREVASLFLGKHDFKAFCKVDKKAKDRSTVRIIDSIMVTPFTLSLDSTKKQTWSEARFGGAGGSDMPFDPPMEIEVLMVDLHGQSFLWQMVRRMMAAMVAVAFGDLDLEGVEEGLSTGKRVDLEALPAENLILMDVVHDLEFTKVEGTEGLMKALFERWTWPLASELLLIDHTLKSLRKEI